MSGLADSVRELSGKTWEDLDAVYKQDVEAVLVDLENLLALKFLGKDVEQELAEVKATLANYSFVGASVVRANIVQALEAAGEGFAAFLKGLVGGILGG